ncbi:MAG TPA: MjaI family restriction endonuclease [bacterium]|nr:MjaI family restriction endonuclease [bacterium]
MAREWILNSAMNRFQLNFKRNVGPTSESIRQCAPKTIEEWSQYYFRNVRPKEHIESLGKKLYIKITEVIQAEVEEITEQDCIDYMIQLSQIFKEKELQQRTHEKFTNDYGGKVFYVYSAKSGDKKVIVNKEVVGEILQEIERLKK